MSAEHLLRRVSAVAVIAVSGLCTATNAAQDTVSFSQQIRPLLSDRCFSCHGFDETHRAADLRLDQREGSEDVLAPGNPNDSELLRRILSDDSDEVMPPPDAHKPAFKPEEIELLRTWIQQGAKYEKHWAFRALAAPRVPKVSATEGLTDIDQFVVKPLQRDSLSLNSKADPRTLFRRLCLDLTGLPPTAKQLQRFLSDSKPGAWERAVDQLLQSPQYGEHMARYWLDLVRFSDTNGLHHDHYRDMTPYRDWVIDSFNNNRPFDEFVVDQVAGDLYPEPTTDQLVASGFNRLHLIIDIGTALPEESFHRNVVDRVTAVGTAFMGLTVQCASCHDHKYDPITQRDFYQLYAFFNNFDGGPETGRRGTQDFKRGLQAPYINLPSEEQQVQLAALDAQISAQQQAGKTNADSFKQLQSQREALMLQIPAAMVMKERSDSRPTHLLVRGQYDAPGDQVERNTPGFLPPMKSDAKERDRMDLAQWLVASDHPLTARVTVNRFWQQVFGTGLVRTSEDFGAQGEVPSHPQLLDHLATDFIQSGWDVKRLMKSIVMSRTYQQSSSAPLQAWQADPDNRRLARGARYRLDAEVIRDQILLTSGLLNLEMYGRSVKPPQPDGLWKLVAMPSSYPRIYQADTGDNIYRRSLYTFWKRALPPPQMTILDAPTRESCVARRERTNTPLQALLLMNEQQYFQAALHLAQQVLKSDASDVQRIRNVYERITSRKPSEATERQLVTSLEQFRSLYAEDASLTSEMMSHCRDQQTIPATAQQQSELAAWTMIAHSLLNLDAVRNHE